VLNSDEGQRAGKPGVLACSLNKETLKKYITHLNGEVSFNKDMWLSMFVVAKDHH